MALLIKDYRFVLGVIGGVVLVVGAYFIFRDARNAEAIVVNRQYLANDEGTVVTDTIGGGMTLAHVTSGATSTVIVNMGFANGLDWNITHNATNTPATLNMQVEYSDDTANCSSSSVTCKWFAETTTQRNTSIGITGTSTSEYVFPIIRQRLLVNRSTTSENIAGPRNVHHQWARVGFRLSEGGNLIMFAQVLGIFTP